MPYVIARQNWHNTENNSSATYNKAQIKMHLQKSILLCLTDEQAQLDMHRGQANLARNLG